TRGRSPLAPNKHKVIPAIPAQQRLFSYLGETLLAFCAERPLLLLLDDLQWADELSLGFLRVFLRIETLARWLLVGTFRPKELGAERLSAMLDRVVSFPEENRWEALRELFRRQIFEERAPGLLRFAHDKLREVAYGRLSAEARRGGVRSGRGT